MSLSGFPFSGGLGRLGFLQGELTGGVSRGFRACQKRLGEDVSTAIASQYANQKPSQHLSMIAPVRFSNHGFWRWRKDSPYLG